MFKPGTKFAAVHSRRRRQAARDPVRLGVLATTYNSDKVKAPEGLDDFLSAPYAGKFAIGDDGPRVIGVVAKSMGLGGTDALGRSPAPYLLTQADMDKVMAKLDQFKDKAQNIIANPYGEYSSAYGRGEIVAAFPDWPPTAATAQSGGVPREDSDRARRDLLHGQLLHLERRRRHAMPTTRSSTRRSPSRRSTRP